MNVEYVADWPIYTGDWVCMSRKILVDGVLDFEKVTRITFWHLNFEQRTLSWSDPSKGNSGIIQFEYNGRAIVADKRGPAWISYKYSKDQMILHKIVLFEGRQQIVKETILVPQNKFFD